MADLSAAIFNWVISLFLYLYSKQTYWGSPPEDGSEPKFWGFGPHSMMAILNRKISFPLAIFFFLFGLVAFIMWIIETYG